jgi:ribose/xylose/arabinose/galactoside ABC-type transport system permease subunit
MRTGEAAMNATAERPVSLQRHAADNPWWKLVFNLAGVLVAGVFALAVFQAGRTLFPEGPFASTQNLHNITLRWLEYAMVAPAAVLIVAMGSVDLSVGAVLGLTGLIVSALAPAVGLPAACLAGLLAALAVGIVNGLLAGGTRIHPAVITLGMAVLLRGITLLSSQARPVMLSEPGFLSDPALPWVGLGLGLLLGVPLALVSLKRPLRRGEPDEKWATRLFYTASPYILSAFMAGVAGLTFLGRVRAALPTAGTGFEVEVLLIALLGGTPLVNLSISLGIVNLIGALLAGLGFSALQNLINLSNSQLTLLEPIKGIAILLVGLISTVYYFLVARISAGAAREPMDTQP